MTKRTERTETTAYTVTVHLTDQEVSALLAAVRNDDYDRFDEVAERMGTNLIEQLVALEEQTLEAVEREFLGLMAERRRCRCADCCAR